MEDESSDEEFSAMRLPSLIDQLKRLLEQYSDGQILKELIQNAEDGGATRIKVMFVNKHHQPSTPLKMWKENPIQFAMKGPALCVYNDGLFTKEDWEGIAAIQCSGKENEPLKVGRFGLGFKSVFHITDTPLILSGSKLMIINPAANVHDVVVTKKFRKIDEKSKKEILDLMSGIFGFSPEVFQLQAGFNGTLFWFPLRTVESSLCKTIYDEDKIRDIFHGFTSLAPSILLFLKKIEIIEIYEKHSETRKLFEVCLDADDLLMLRQDRKLFVQEIERFNGRFASQPVKNILRPKVRFEGFDWLKMETSEDEWLIINHYHGGDVSAELRNLVEGDDWPYSPYVSIAACLSKPITKGHVFCFLPLPLEGQSLTGLPVHVNGFFALSQDRHHVRWNSSEQDRNNSHTEKSILWNQYLVKEILPQVYTNLILQLIDDERDRSRQLTCSERSQRADIVYGTLPNNGNVTDNWKNMIDPIFHQLYSTACMFTKREEGIWTEPQNTVFTKIQDESMVDSVEHAYLLCGRNFSRAPICILDAFRKHGPITFISAEHLREELLQHPEVAGQLNVKVKLNLLRYILDNNDNCLQGLTLLPLADGNFCTFTTGNTEVVYIFENVEDMKMFPGLESHFVKSELEPDLYLKIQNQCSREIGKFQIKIFDPNEFSHLIDLCIKQNQWQGIKLTKPLEVWLELVWTYIGKYKKLIIKKIKCMDLLPYKEPKTGEERLIKTSEIAILESYTGNDSLHEPLIGALEKLNIKVYKSLPEYISTVVAGTFVEYPTSAGLVNCFRRITEDDQVMERSVMDFNSRCSVSEKKALLVKLNTIENISNTKKLLRRLHLFSLTPGVEMDVCLDDVNEIFDGSKELHIPIKPHEKMIHCSDKLVESFYVALKLEAKQKSFSEIISKILQDLSSGSFYSENEKLQFMEFFVENIKEFENDEVKMKLARSIQFIENLTGQYCCPSELFDPKPKLLQDLFHYDKSVFPSTRYVDNLTNLKKLGLRGVCDIKDNEILTIANFINEQYLNNGRSDLSSMSVALLEYLNTDENSLDVDTIKRLSTLTWCPVMDNRPDGYPEKLEFAAEGHTNLLKKPCELIHYDYVYLVGGKQFIARKDIPVCLTKFFMNILTIEYSVTDQLLFVSKDYSERSVTEQSKFMAVLEHIYGFLTKHKIYTGLSEKRVIWTGSEGKFQIPENVWLNKKQTDIPLDPYMFSLPDTFFDFKDWFLGIGCESEQSNGVLLKTLRQIKDKHDNVNEHQPEVVTKDLSLVIQIVNTLVNSKEDVSQEILLPIFTESEDVLQLKPAQECTVCNEDWLSDLVSTSTQAETDPIYFIHKRISKDTAEIFKVPVLTDRVLRNAESFDMNFGQTEPLTIRLHNLLKDYTDGFTIPKEIIQNADDAGATTVKLLYDERIVKEAQTCLFNEGMIPCQGPAFWAYNDAMFTEDDFRNITRLAGATKKDESMKIGRFGLGFNSVYNLTDVPSFLSGETYVVFDPHESHLGTCGLKINLNFPGNQLMRHKMKGQFYPFEGVFGCNIVNKDRVHFKGTLFRFPLRNSDEASKSEIKDISYSKSEMKEFIKKIEDGAGNLLLFTQHVNKIELYHIEKNSSSGKPELLMEVSKSSNYSEQSVLQTLTETRNADAYCTEKINITLSITHCSKSVCGIDKLDVTVPYTINWSFGQGSSVHEAERNEFKGLLPVAATAFTEVSLQNITGFYMESHLFCFLPLPIKSKLPVLINASFAVQSSRRDLMWRNEDDKESECVEDRWNTVLLEDAGSQAYIRMLTTMAARLSPEEYYRLWPSEFSQPKHDKILTREVYITMCKGDWAVFPSNNRIVSLKQSAILCPELTTIKDVGNIALRALRYFVIEEKQKLSNFAAVFTIIDLPTELLNNFKLSGCENQINERIVSVEDFYKEIVFPNLKNAFWLKEELDEIILHGLLSDDNVILDLIKKHKCIPTRPDGERKLPAELIHPHRELANLFSVEEECFPEENKFTMYNTLKVLESLGMKTDELEWEHLPKRIRSVLDSGRSELLINRTEKFLRYMTATRDAEQRYQKCPDEIRKELSNLEFLTLQRPPCSWTLPWYGGDNKERPFTSPINGYFPQCQHLVGCIKPVVDVNKYTHNSKITDVLKWLGLRHLGSGIDLKLVIENLLIISKHTMESGLKYDGYIMLETVFQDIYGYLRKVVEEDNEEDIHYIQQSLECKAVVLHERTLKTADKMVMELRNNLSPYLFEVDLRYKRYKDLFLILGVNMELTFSMIIGALLLFSEEKGSTKLSPDELDSVNRLCNEFEQLCDQQTVDTVDKHAFGSIKLPDENSVLKFTKDLYFDDSPWLSNDLTQTHLHKKFSRSVAELMGVKSKRSHDIESLSSPLFSEFGQHEDLTNRIKRILEGYPCDESILKEMLQNADDAGATEVIFIKDFRQLETNSLPGDKLSQIQGPALCIYNNSCFSEQDLKGIQALGLGSKSDEVLKTGQYGVGFNVVYHVTDAPSFWSKGGEIGELVCICDPHCKYLQSATERRPGSKIQVSGLRGRYTDFMEGYLPKFTNRLDRGTLFRLPLRTKDMAAASKIRTEQTSTQEIEEIITKLKKQIIPCMLFLENITNIKIASVDQNGDLNIEHEVSIKMTREDTEKQKVYNNYLCELSHKMGDLQADTLNAPLEIQITLNFQETKSDKPERFAIVKRVGFLPECKFPEKLSKAYDKGIVQKLPRGGVAINLSSKVNGNAYCTLPLPIQTGLPVHINGQFALDHESRRNLRCESDSVEGQWNSHLANYVIVPAYISALNYFKGYPLNSRQTALDVEKLKKMVDKFEKLFPILENATDIFWKDLSKNIYKWIAINKCPMFPVFTKNTNNWWNIKWVDIQIGDDGGFAGFFNILHTHFKEHESTPYYRSSGIAIMHNTMDKKPKTKDNLAKILVDLGMMILQSSELLLKQFKYSEIDVQTVTPENVLRFLKSYSKMGLNNRCKLDNLPCDISNTIFRTPETLKLVLEFVIKHVKENNVDILYGAPLLLRQNNILEDFRVESRVIVSEFCGLLSEHSSEFLAYSIINLMDKFLESFKPLVKWSLQSFANLMQLSDEKVRICRCEIVPWDDTMPVSKAWLLEAWKFICGHLPSGFTRSKLSVSALKDINSFSLLPVKIGQRKVLYPLSLASHIMDMTNVPVTSTYQKVVEVLGELQIPKLLMISPFIIHEFVVNIENPSAVLQLLIENINRLLSINIKQSEALWKYFNMKVEDMNNVTLLQKIPIFETHDGKMVSLCEGSKTYTCLRDSFDSVPKVGLQHWSSVSNVEILRYHYDLQNIFQKIGVQVNKPIDLYTNYILEHFHGFNDEDQITHLQYIRDVLLCNLNPKEKDRLIGKLKDVKFIRYNGTTRTVSQFYDRDNKIFEVMGDHLIFPPPPYGHRVWKKLLILLGLQAEVSPNMFVKFAEIVERSGVTDQSLEQSYLLVTHLFREDYIKDKQFCERIKNIKFVSRLTLPNEDFRSGIYPQYGLGDRFICLNGSFESSCVDYVWTVSNILPPSVCVRSNNFFGIQTEIKPSFFIDHLKNICTNLADANRLQKINKTSLRELFTNLYGYMGRHTNIDLSDLRDYHTIFLPDEMLMVKASKVIIEPDNGQLIKNRIFRIPVDFVCYRQLFEKLGAIITGVPDIYLGVLREIFTECNGKELDPNLSTTVGECIQQLNNMWKEPPPNVYLMNEPHLYLPDKDTLMAKSTELVFVDNMNIYRKVSKLSFRYFVGAKALGIKNCLISAWPKKYQMKKLTKLINVTIEPSCIDNATKGSVARTIKNKLIDESFLNGVVRLLKHNQEEQQPISDAKYDETLSNGVELFTDIEVFEVNNLMTVLMYSGEVVPESNELCSVHFKKKYNDNTTTYSLYIDKSQKVISKLDKKLSDIIRHIFNADIGPHFRYIWQLMVEDSPLEIESYLDKENIKTDDFVSRFILFPPPGTCIPERLHWLLDNSFSKFDKGDYVGYEIFDPDIEDVDGEGNTTESPYYIYAKIVGLIQEETDSGFASYSIDVGEEEPIQATVTRIYKFHRNNTNTSRDLVVSDTRQTEQRKCNTIEELDINTILKDIRQTMKRAWQCSDKKERKRVTRRLLLTWHPDKNPNNALKATEITKKIFMYVERLDRGLSLDEESVPDETDGATRSHSHSYERFYSNVYSTGRNHARYSQEQRSKRRYYTESSFHTSAQYEPNPSPGQAVRWMKQAEWDLKAAEQSLSSGANIHNWICYKCQQSAEKALKAVWYKIDANKVSQDHNLNHVACGLPYPGLVQLATELQSTIGEHTRMRYPDKLSYPDIPHDAYNESHSTPACALTRKIISISTNIIHG